MYVCFFLSPTEEGKTDGAFNIYLGQTSIPGLYAMNSYIFQGIGSRAHSNTLFRPIGSVDHPNGELRQAVKKYRCHLRQERRWIDRRGWEVRL